MNFVKIAATALTLAFGATLAVAQTTPTAPKAPMTPTATTPAPAVTDTTTPPKMTRKQRAAATVAATTTAPTTTTTTTKTGTKFTSKTPQGQACGAEADAKNIHGKKLRRPFMRKCEKDWLATHKS